MKIELKVLTDAGIPLGWFQAFDTTVPEVMASLRATLTKSLAEQPDFLEEFEAYLNTVDVETKQRYGLRP